MTATDDQKRYAAEANRRLTRAYPDAKCSLDFRSPLQLLVAAVLSAQCTDRRVNPVTKELFAKYGDASDYARAALSELEEDIRSTGFFRNKAKSIKECCQQLLDEHDGRVPQEMEQLVALSGIGRKTANVILGTAYEIVCGVVVDTHVGRISRRLGLTRQKNPEKIEQELMEQFPQEVWTSLSHRMIYHGRAVCTARKPKCEKCPLGDICPRVGVGD